MPRGAARRPEEVGTARRGPVGSRRAAPGPPEGSARWATRPVARARVRPAGPAPAAVRVAGPTPPSAVVAGRAGVGRDPGVAGRRTGPRAVRSGRSRCPAPWPRAVLPATRRERRGPATRRERRAGRARGHACRGATGPGAQGRRVSSSQPGPGPPRRARPGGDAVAGRWVRRGGRWVGRAGRWVGRARSSRTAHALRHPTASSRRAGRVRRARSSRRARRPSHPGSSTRRLPGPPRPGSSSRRARRRGPGGAGTGTGRAAVPAGGWTANRPPPRPSRRSCRQA